MPVSIDPSTDGETSQTGDQAVILDILFDHRAEVLREFLRQKSMPSSGTKEQLRNRIEGHLGTGDIKQADLIDLLDTIEGWGNQHIYLLKAPANSPVLKQFEKEATVRAMLREHKSEHLFNNRRRLMLPATPQLASVEWTEKYVSFVWVERRMWRERRPDLDHREKADSMVEFDAYQVFRGRGLMRFELDLVSGQAAFFIQRLPSGNDYDSVRGRFYAQLQTMFDILSFNPIRVGRSIIHLEKIPGVRRRQIEHATERGSRISYVSSERQVDAFADPSLERARRAAGDRVIGRLGNYYWKTKGDEREVHVKVYASDHRIGIFGECSETEVRHVLRNVRQHSR